ncbi:MAG: hypothetical protein H6714_04110 [Myxococcales bacterium]|nr:hypothetical protein [Myxococcales bacterium]
MTRKWFRSYAIGLGIAALLSSLVLRVVFSSRSEWQEAHALNSSGDREAAIIHYRRAVRWYAPFNPYPRRALEALYRLGAEFEQEGDVHGALAAYRAMRAGIMSTRSFYTPHRTWLAKADKKIASLMAFFAPIPSDAGKSPKARTEEYAKQLARPDRPGVFFTLMLMLGFAAWTIGALMFFERGFDEDNRLIVSQARVWGIIILAGMVLFVLGASLA